MNHSHHFQCLILLAVALFPIGVSAEPGEPSRAQLERQASAWMEEHPGSPVAATVRFSRPVGSSGLKELLAAAGAAPYRLTLKAGDVSGVYRVDVEQADLTVVDEARRVFYEMQVRRLESKARLAAAVLIDVDERGRLKHRTRVLEAQALIDAANRLTHAMEEIASDRFITEAEVLTPPQNAADLVTSELAENGYLGPTPSDTFENPMPSAASTQPPVSVRSTSMATSAMTSPELEEALQALVSTVLSAQPTGQGSQDR